MARSTTQAISRIKQAVRSRTCPLTNGRATTFYGREAFRRSCKAKQDEASHDWIEGKKVKLDTPLGRCGTCLGKRIPPEIEIKAELEVKTMGTGTNKSGSCELCRGKAKLRNVHQVNACPVCQRILADVNNRLEIVLGAMRHLKPERLVDLVDGTVREGGESVALERIAEIVGHAGDDGEGLIAAVDAWEEKFKHEPALAALDAMRRSLGLSEECSVNEVERHVAETSAMLENVERSVCEAAALLEDAPSEHAEEIERLRALLDVGGDVDPRLLVDDLIFRFDRLRESHKQLEALNARNEQIFASVAEVLQAPGMPPAEIVLQIKALRAAAGYYSTLPLQLENFGQGAGGPSIELAIGGLSIKINGLSPEATGAVHAG